MLESGPVLVTRVFIYIIVFFNVSLTSYKAICLEQTIVIKTVQVGNDQEMAQSERNFHSINRGVGKKLK